VFTLAVDNFSIPMILGGRVGVLSSLTYQPFLSETGGHPLMRSVLAVVSALLGGAALLVPNGIAGPRTDQLRRRRGPRAVRAKGLSAVLLTGGAVLFVAFSMIPAVTVIIGAFTKARGPVMQYGTWTLENMERALRNAPEPIINSLMLASVAAIA